MLDALKHNSRIKVNISVFTVNIFGCVLVIKIFVLARIIMAATQIVRIDRDVVNISAAEKVVIIL
jgi:hypothetical protein